MKQKLASAVVFFANLLLACSGGSGGVAGNAAVCTSVENEIESRCGAPADLQATQKGLDSCRASAADTRCGQLYTAVLQCMSAEVSRRGLCPGTSNSKVKIEGCQSELSAYAKCKTPGGTVVSDASTPPEPSSCRSESTCINGACKCASGPHLDEPCCPPSDSTCTGEVTCDSLCEVCQ